MSKKQEGRMKKIVWDDCGHIKAVRGFVEDAGELININFPDGGVLRLNKRLVLQIKEVRI